MAGCSFTACKQTATSGSGGGAIAARAKTLEISASSFTGCEGATGGAVYHYGADVNTLTVTNTTLTGCKATGESQTAGFGGGIYASAANNDLNGVTVKNCTATVSGGGVYQVNQNNKVSTLKLSGGTAISEGTAINGGGVYAEGNVTMSGKASVANNRASINGGGVALEGEATLTMSGNADITGNRATGDAARGGGVYLDSESVMTLSGSAAVTGNSVTAQANGGGVYIAGETTKDEEENETVKSGKVHVQGSVKITGNKAGTDASNLAVYGDTSLVVDGNLNISAAIGICTEKEADIDQIGVENGVKANLNKITYDRDTGIYAIPFGTKKVVWNFTPVVKLTDGSDNLLYRNADLEPAVYATLAEGFEAAANGLVKKDGSEYETADAVKLKLLLDYTLKGKDEATGQKAEIITYDTGRNLTMTTAEKKQGNTDGYFYTPAAGVKANDPRYTCATVKRGDGDRSMFTVNTANTVTVSNLIIDGDREKFDKVAVNGGLFNVAAGKLVIADGATLHNSGVTGDGTANGNGGAVYAANGGTVEMTGGTINGNAAINGGAVYAVVGATVTVKDGTKAAGATAAPHVTITGNTTAEYGAGIYLAEGATLNLEGSPSFGGAGATETVIDSTAGNFTETALASGATNGQLSYARVRQDIYVAGYLGKVGDDPRPATAIVVTGNITSGDGSIWVAAEKPADKEENNHYEMLKQFAVVKRGVTIGKATMHAFRNAWDDETTGCGADYLTGQDGDDLEDANRVTWKCIYWTGGFDFVFKKVDGEGEALNGAVFTLYMAVEESAGKYVPAMLNGEGKYVPATSADATTWAAYQQSDKDGGGKKNATGTSAEIPEGSPVKIKVNEGTETSPDVKEYSIYGKGLVRLEKIPPGVYFLKETMPLTVTVDGKTRTYAAVEDLYRIDLNGKGYYAITRVSMEQAADGKYTCTDLGAAPVETLKLGAGADAYTVDVALALNVDARSRKVILRKVDEGSYAPLEGAKFTVYFADRKTVVKLRDKDGKSVPVVDVNGEEHAEMKDLTSGKSGVFWIGELPYGIYYMAETTPPDKYTAPTHYFVFKVDENGVSKPVEDDWTATNALAESTRDADKIPASEP